MKKIVNILLILSFVFSTSVVSFAEKRVVRTDFPINLDAFSEEYNKRSVGEDIYFRSYYYYDDPSSGERKIVLSTVDSEEVEIVKYNSGDYAKIPEGHFAGYMSMIQIDDDPDYYKKPENWSFGTMSSLGPVPRKVEDFHQFDPSVSIHASNIRFRLHSDFNLPDWQFFPLILPGLSLAALGATISRVIYLIASSGVLILCFLILPILLKKLLKSFLNL